MGRDKMYTVTTDGCGRLYLELPDGEVLATAEVKGESMLELNLAIVKMFDEGLETEDRMV